MNLRQWIFSDLYRKAETDSSLPWHRDEPPRLLATVVEQRRFTGKALDLGCGEGVASTYLAGKGYSVVGVDFVAGALERARSRASAQGATLKLVQSDVLNFASEDRFEVVLDSGCLHHISSAKLARYTERLEQWLAPSGDYVLVHFKKRHALDWRPLGPTRKTKEQILALFPWLQLQAEDEITFDLPFPVGMSVAGVYWLKRAQRA